MSPIGRHAATLLGLLVALPVSTSALPRFPVTVANINTTNSSLEDFAELAPFDIQNCGERTTAVQNSIRMIQTLAVQSIDVTNRRGSLYSAFTAMFKGQRSAMQVAAMINDLRELTDMETAQVIHIRCVTDDYARGTQLQRHVAARCAAHEQTAVIRGESRYQFVCPRFFDRPQQWPAGESMYCPAVKNNQYAQDPARPQIFPTQTQPGLLLQLAILELLNRGDVQADPVHALNFVVCRSQRQSLEYPFNFYFFMLLVLFGCDSNPNPFEPPFSLPKPLGPNVNVNNMTLIAEGSLSDSGNGQCRLPSSDGSQDFMPGIDSMQLTTS